MRLLTRLLSTRPGPVVLSTLACFVSLGATFLWNARLSELIDALNAGRARPLADALSALPVMLLSAALAFALALCSGWACEALAHELRMGCARHLCGLSALEMAGVSAGEQVAKLQSEAGEAAAFLRGNLFDIVFDLLRFLGTLLFLASLNPRLTLLANAPCAVLLCYAVFASRMIGEAAIASQQANAQMGGFAQTMLAVFPVLRLYDAAPLLTGAYREALRRWEEATIAQERRRAALMSLSAALSLLPLLVLFLVGGGQVIRGQASIGELYVFLNLSGNVSGVMMNMPGRIAGFRRFMANMERLAPSVDLLKGRAAREH